MVVLAGIYYPEGYKVGPMSSLVAAGSQAVFGSVRENFGRLAEEYGIVLIAKISNACPEIDTQAVSL